MFWYIKTREAIWTHRQSAIDSWEITPSYTLSTRRWTDKFLMSYPSLLHSSRMWTSNRAYIRGRSWESEAPFQEGAFVSSRVSWPFNSFLELCQDREGLHHDVMLERGGHAVQIANVRVVQLPSSVELVPAGKYRICTCSRYELKLEYKLGTAPPSVREGSLMRSLKYRSH